jgi:hypothetical protein
MGRYDAALGFGSGEKVQTGLSVGGFTTWAVSKTPAVVGGLVAQWVYDWANKRWPNNKRGPQFVGGIGIVVAAYGLAVAASKWASTSSGAVDKMTDGMLGRASPVVVGLLKGLLGVKDNTSKPAQGTSAPSVDGDREAAIELMGMVAASPETTQDLADQMFQIMGREGVQMDEAGKRAVVKSMREASRKIAAGQF